MKTYYSPFKVGDDVIHLGALGYGTARVITITGETATEYTCGKLRFKKSNSNIGSLKGIGDNSYTCLTAITPELLETVKETLKAQDEQLKEKANEKAEAASDEAEYLAWIETDEGKVMEALQADWIGATITHHIDTAGIGRRYELRLIGVGGEAVADLRIRQNIRRVSEPDRKHYLERSMISFSNQSFSSGQAVRFQEMVEIAIQIAKEWDEDIGKEWK